MCLNAIFTSSSRLKHDAITKMCMGTNLRNAGDTTNAQSQSIMDVISYFLVAHTWEPVRPTLEPLDLAQDRESKREDEELQRALRHLE